MLILAVTGGLVWLGGARIRNIKLRIRPFAEYGGSGGGNEGSGEGRRPYPPAGAGKPPGAARKGPGDKKPFAGRDKGDRPFKPKRKEG